MREAPSMRSRSLKKFNHKSQAEIKAMVDSIPQKPKKVKKVHKPKPVFIDTRRPQDVIEPPNASIIKEVFTRVVPITKKEEINLKEMSIVEKTIYFTKLKSQKLREAENKKIKEMLQECTFKPDTCKGEEKVRFHSKSKSAFTSPKKNLLKTSKPDHVKEMCIPAPYAKLKKSSSKFNSKSIENSKLFISPSYSQLSPVRNAYHFQEGADIDKILKNSRVMLEYNTLGSRNS